MRVFLIHGMGRSRASMIWLARRLSRAGHRPSRFGYSVMRRDIDAIVASFVAHIEAALEPGETYAIVGHSLGNIITRAAGDRLPEGLCRFVMLAPPNRSPSMARRLKNNLVFRFATGDAGQKLADPAFYEALGRPDVPTLIFAGEVSGRQPFWLDGGSDGIVKVDETPLDDLPHHVVDALHTFIMNHPEVAERILAFLE